MKQLVNVVFYRESRSESDVTQLIGRRDVGTPYGPARSVFLSHTPADYDMVECVNPVFGNEQGELQACSGTIIDDDDCNEL